MISVISSLRFQIMLFMQEGRFFFVFFKTGLYCIIILIICMCHWNMFVCAIKFNRIFREATLLNRAIGEILKHVNRQGKCKISACRVVDSVYFGWRWMMTLSVSRRFVTELTIDCTCRSARVLHLQQLTYYKLLATCLGYWADAWSTYMWIYNFSSLRNGSSTWALFLILSSFESLNACGSCESRLWIPGYNQARIQLFIQAPPGNDSVEMMHNCM